MRLLLDTHVLLWVRIDSPQLPVAFREAIADPDNIKLVSSITLAEVAVKRAVGKLRAPDDFAAGLESIGLDHLAFDHRHARTLDRLPLLHRDPFDRMLVAQAISEDVPFLTVDQHCLAYDVRTL
ncbi:type II toxin-antitoxin system VapC family toxin [Luteipulveratus halotolerans]|uniref:PIN domain-containing protein n=1 Tax=Luteipulveratus halotolerans TaxID=1631356 RepID=A0A0L6CMB8_9MICO|nr:type II toxin-antitoxin system VapC family toxin [Luteipulveratus halotolerans]KNX38678.1 hypothetical protein VV01_18445 [Luteipulveratus halotolerans]